MRECPECHSKNLVWDRERGELFCSDCGLVIDENLFDLGHEWQDFDFEQASNSERLVHILIAETQAEAEECVKKRGKRPVDFLAPTDVPLIYRIHDEVSTLLTSKYVLGRCRILTSSERSLIYALSEIDRMASVLGLPMNIREATAKLYRKVMEKNLNALSEIHRMASALKIPMNIAAELYRKEMEKNLIRVRSCSIEGITSAILYITCRQYGVPLTFEEIKAVSRASRDKISRAYEFLLRELDIHLPPASPIEFVPRFCSRLGLGGDVRAKAIEIIKKAQEKKLTNGKGPIGVAAAAIYIAAILSGKHKTQKEISEATGVTEVTIRNRYRELIENGLIDISEFLCCIQ